MMIDMFHGITSLTVPVAAVSEPLDPVTWLAPLQSSAIADWSRQHCLAICAFLVPANLIATIQTLVAMVLGRSLWERSVLAIAAAGYALAMVLHVATWYAIGVVMAPTYILLSLALVCLAMNSRALVLAWRDRRPAVPPNHYAQSLP